MTSTGTAQRDRALAREWLAMRIVVIGGFAVALVAAIYFGIVVPKIIAPRELRATLTHQIRTLLTQEQQVCTTALASAKNFGIVPQYGQLATARLAQTNVQGRYACLAATHAAKYVMIVDLLCRNLKDQRCVSLYNISQTDGTMLYQRQR
ncbi:MAG TPA: hypothetical protein VHT03_04245 [Rhizomicrobium sp.]|jgi:hypothetical protein|nr:hypothetical protein [Rhizomicrobium sp.]